MSNTSAQPKISLNPPSNDQATHLAPNQLPSTHPYSQSLFTPLQTKAALLSLSTSTHPQISHSNAMESSLQYPKHLRHTYWRSEKKLLEQLLSNTPSEVASTLRYLSYWHQISSAWGDKWSKLVDFLRQRNEAGSNWCCLLSEYFLRVFPRIWWSANFLKTRQNAGLCIRLFLQFSGWSSLWGAAFFGFWGWRLAWELLCRESVPFLRILWRRRGGEGSSLSCRLWWWYP